MALHPAQLFACQTTDAYEHEYAAGDEYGRQSAKYQLANGGSTRYRDHYPVGAPWTATWSRPFVEGHRDGFDAIIHPEHANY